jgi:hypothetical protein
MLQSSISTMQSLSQTSSVRVYYPGYRGPLVTTQNSGYDWFPPVTNGWGTIHPIPDMTLPLLAEEEGPGT